MSTFWISCTSSCPSTFEVVEPSQSNELQKCLLSFWKWEVKDLDTLLFGVNEVPVLDIRCPTYSTSFLVCWVGGDFLASIAEVFIISRTMYQNIVYIYLAYACDIACQYFVGHTTLKERARAFESHGDSVLFKQSVYSCESGCRGV
jgi:hypothetical protein